MLARSGKASADEAMLTRIYQAQLDELEHWLVAHSAFSVLPVAHHRAIHEPLEVAAEINTFLGGGLDTAAMVAAVDPSLHRQRLAPESR
jgi:hypothetical protein